MTALYLIPVVAFVLAALIAVALLLERNLSRHEAAEKKAKDEAAWNKRVARHEVVKREEAVAAAREGRPVRFIPFYGESL